MPTMTINRKLLQACRITYTIKTSATGSTITPGADAFAWEQVQIFTAGTNAIDAALLIETADEVILAFRGTTPLAANVTPKMLADWLNDFDADLVNGVNLPGKVHDGFQKSLIGLWPALAPALAAAVARGPGLPLYVTGHSKGGALANLAAMRAVIELHLAPTVVTIAAAKPGDVTFQAAYDTKVPSTRFEYADDIVPHVPPSDLFRAIPGLEQVIRGIHLGYISVGTLQFIDWNGDVQAQSPALRTQRNAHMAVKLLTLQINTIADDHRIKRGSGYDKGVR